MPTNWYYVSVIVNGKEYKKIDSIESEHRCNTHPHNIYFEFPKYYKKNLANKFDSIIDEAGGMPLFSPLFEKEIPIIFMIHHIWDKEWDFKYSFPLNKIWKFLFKKTIKIYKNNFPNKN